MHWLNVLTLTSVFLMIGVELSVSLFVNPVSWQLELEAQEGAVSLFATRFGKAMPFWYAGNLSLLGLETWFWKHQAGFARLLTGSVIWAAVIVLTLTLLVPINNRLAARSAADWQQQHRRWNALHIVRIVLLTIAGLLAASVLVG